MRVGVLTSHRVPCGVAQYSERFVEALSRIPDIEPVILAGRADEHRSVPEEWSGEVHDVADIGLWRDDQTYNLDIIKILGLDLDAIHVQYQSMLFDQEDLCCLANRFYGVKAITFHDNCQRPDFPYRAFDLRFTHRANVGQGEVIPFGIEDRPPVVRTFGLGRTRSDYIRPICERNGWVFESAASHEPIQGGGQAWRAHNDLIEWLRGADAIVLWYDDNGMAGSSQAARTAIASRRPVITNDTTWFSDLPEWMVGYKKVASLEALEDALSDEFTRDYVQQNSWNSVAHTITERYRGALVSRGAPAAFGDSFSHLDGLDAA
jgi:hypothetical protein